MKDNEFIINVNGLAQGESIFLSHAGKEFFAKNENYEVLDADLQVTIVAVKQSDCVDFDCDITGTLTVPCDRCMQPVAMPVSAAALFRLRLNGSTAVVEDPCEEVFLPEGSDVINLDQEIYDYSLLALPLQRFHKEGECDSVALGYLSEEDNGEKPETTDLPFSALADMLNDKIKNL